jgi:hypothetical protein
MLDAHHFDVVAQERSRRRGDYRIGSGSGSTGEQDCRAAEVVKHFWGA